MYDVRIATTSVTTDEGSVALADTDNEVDSAAAPLTASVPPTTAAPEMVAEPPTCSELLIVESPATDSVLLNTAGPETDTEPVTCVSASTEVPLADSPPIEKQAAKRIKGRHSQATSGRVTITGR